MTHEDLAHALIEYGLSHKETGNFTRKLDGCRWIAACDYAGYGTFGYQGKTWKSHRLVYSATHPDEDITDLFIVQSCGDHRCCDPNCLHSQKNRPMRCDPNEYQGKLSARTVDRLRRLPYDETNKCDIARTLGVSPSTVTKAMKGTTWKRRPMSPGTSDAGSSKSTTKDAALTTTTLRLGGSSGAHPWRGQTSPTSKITSQTRALVRSK